MARFTKPNSPYQKNYANKREEVIPEPNFAASEMDQAAHAASNPASQDFPTQEGADMSDAEIKRRYRASLSNTILPTPPNIPGFHVCWVPMTSNNHFDTVDFRKQLGYSVVKEEEVPGYVTPSNRSAQLEGCVSHNELVLMKISIRLYQIHMKDSHHDQPNEQERSIKESIDSRLRDEEGASVKRDDAEMTGMRKLARKVKEPTFS